MNRKIILVIMCFVFMSMQTFAQSQTSKTLSRIENSLYGIEYTKQSDIKRLERIEETIYGVKKEGDIKKRLSSLNDDVSTNQMGQEITAKRDTFEDPEDEIITEDTSKTAQNFDDLNSNSGYYDNYEEQADTNIEYPVVNDLEKMTFNKEYKDLDIKKRILNLENTILKKTYQNENLASRVERLKNKTAYVPLRNQDSLNKYDFYTDDGSSINDSDYMQYNDNYFSSKNQMQKFVPENDFTISDDDITDRDFRAKLNKIEKNVLSQSYSNDSIGTRLSRLEGMIFNTTFLSDSDVTRLNRLSSATKAQKTAKKYDSNVFQQKVAAALQIGMFVLMVVAMIL